MKGTVSIAMHSTLHGRSFKGGMLGPLIDELRHRQALECAYGLKCLRERTPADVRASALPIAVMFLAEKLARLRLLPASSPYLLSEMATGWLYAGRASRDDAGVLLCRERPCRFLDAAVRCGKKAVLIYGGMHPLRVREALLAEYDRYAIPPTSTFANVRAAHEAARSLAAAHRVVVQTEATRDSHVAGGVPPEKVRVIHPSMPAPPPAARRGADRAFVCTAYHSLLKGTHRLLEAWRRAGIDRIPLVIVGPLHADMRAYVAREGPFPNVRFVGYRNPNRFYARYDSAVGVLPSIAEGYGRAAAEYLAWGFPAIVTPPATCDIIEDGTHGYVVAHGDDEALAARLRWFADHWEDGRRMGAAAAQAVRDCRDRDHAADLAQLLIDIARTSP